MTARSQIFRPQLQQQKCTCHLTRSLKVQYWCITSRAISQFRAKNSVFMMMFMHLKHQVQVKMDDSHWTAYITESSIKYIFIIWVIKHSLELIPTHLNCINIWFSIPHLLNSPISGPWASRLGLHIGGQRAADSNRASCDSTVVRVDLWWILVWGLALAGHRTKVAHRSVQPRKQSVQCEAH